MGSIYLPYQKPPRWNIDPNGVAYNCARMGLPVPVLAVPMWERGDKVYDYSGNQNHGTNYGATWKTGKLDFDGINDYVSCGSNDVLDLTKGITLSAWVKANTLAPGTNPDYEDTIIAKNTNNKVNGYYSIYIQTGYIAFVIRAGDVDKYAYITSCQIRKWYHIVGTWNGSVMKIYINRQETIGDLLSSVPSSAVDLQIGRLGKSGYEFQFDGIIDNVSIWDVGLSFQQVQVLYSTPCGMFEPIRKSIWIVPVGPTTAAPTTIPPTTLAPTTLPATTSAPTTPVYTTVGPTTVPVATTPISTTLAPTTTAPTTFVPTTLYQTTIGPTTKPPSTGPVTTVPPTTFYPSTTVPTTLQPTTLAPTTLAPTSLAPTTLAPTTLYQTTAAPTTLAPTTLKPTTIPPTTLQPTTLAPTTLAPTTIGPTTIAPTTVPPTTGLPEEICVKDLRSVISKKLSLRSVITEEIGFHGHLC